MKSAVCLTGLIILSILLSACTPGKISALQIPDPGQAPLCEPGQSKSSLLNERPFLSSFEKNQTKVFVEEFTDASQKSKFSVINDEVVLKKNSQLIIYANRNCVLQQNNFALLSAKVKSQVRPVTKPGASANGYYGLILEQDLPLRELQKRATMDSCVIGISPNKNIDLQSTPNDPMYPAQNALTRINHSLRYDQIMNSIAEEVLVAVVDSGNDQAHPDMTDRHWRNSAEQLGITGVDDDGNGFIDDIYGYSWACYVGGDRPTSFWHIPHGEHVAGTIAANANNNEGIVGIAAQKAKMMHLNVVYSGSPLGCGGGTGLEDLVNAIQAIQYAADNGAKVINLSMGKFGRSTAMKDVMEYAVSKGVFVAAAAGNNNKLILDDTESFFFPCGYSKDIEGFACVAATDANPAVENTRCGFSNFSNEFVELSAPGCDSTTGQVDFGINGVISTVRATDTPTYKFMPGTSMATPHIAAAAALVVGYIKTKRRSYPSPAEVEDVLRKGSRLQQNLESSVQGGGRTLDLDVLFKYMDDTLFPTPDPEIPPEDCK